MFSGSIPVDENGNVKLGDSLLTLEEFVELLLKEEATPEEEKLLELALSKKNEKRYLQ